MKSSDLEGFKFLNVKDIDKNRKLLDGLASLGVYVFALRSGTMTTPNGNKTNILYIGCAENVRKQVMDCHFCGTEEQIVGSIHHYLFEKGYDRKVKIGIMQCGCRGDIEREESQLVQRFRAEHDMLPAWNNRP